MTDFSHFLPHATAELLAEQIAPLLSDAAKSDLLLYFAYRKRMAVPPDEVMRRAVQALNQTAVNNGFELQHPDQFLMVMTYVDKAIWPKDEHESREWLMRVE